jgi:translation initiation factor 2 subunit 3
VGSVAGKVDTLPSTLEKVTLEVKLFEKVVGTELAVQVERIRTNEALVLNVGTTVTSGIVTSARENLADIALKKPVCAEPESKVAISRRIADSWRLIGFGSLRA